MAFETKESCGSLWPNDRKESDNQPDRTGKLKLNGVLYSIAAWEKATRDGTPFLSLSIREWEDRPPQQEYSQEQAPVDETDRPF